MFEEIPFSTVSQTTSPSSSIGGGISTLVILVFLFIFITARRLQRGMYGSRFSFTRIFRIPIIYAFFTVVSSIFLPLEDIFFTLAAGSVGLAAGIFWGDTASFFYRNNVVYYKRSPIILMVWLGAFIARLFVEFYFPSLFGGNSNLLLASIIVDILLAGSTGLLAGETIHIYRKYKEFTASPVAADATGTDQTPRDFKF